MRKKKKRSPPKGTSGGGSLLFAALAVLSSGSLILGAGLRFAFKKRLDAAAKAELSSGPPKHLLKESFSSSSPSSFSTDPMNPLSSSSSSSSSVSSPSSSSFSSEWGEDPSSSSSSFATETFLADKRKLGTGSKEAATKLFSSFIGGDDVLASGGGADDDRGGNDDDNDNDGGGGGGDDEIDDRSFSLWATDLNRMKRIWGREIALESAEVAAASAPPEAATPLNPQAAGVPAQAVAPPSSPSSSSSSDGKKQRQGAAAGAASDADNLATLNVNAMESLEQQWTRQQREREASEAATEAAAARAAKAAVPGGGGLDSLSSSSSSSIAADVGVSAATIAATAEAAAAAMAAAEAAVRALGGRSSSSSSSSSFLDAGQPGSPLTDAERFPAIAELKRQQERAAAEAKKKGNDGRGGGGQWTDDLENQERLRWGPSSAEMAADGTEQSRRTDASMARAAAEAERTALMLRGADRGGGGRANHPGGGGSGIGGIDGIGGSGGGGGGGGGASVSEELPLRVLDPRMAQALEGMGSQKGLLGKHARGWFNPANLNESQWQKAQATEVKRGQVGSGGRRVFKGRNVVFIKVAKAGGTTLQGLLDRYGADRHLLVATPEHVRRTTSFHRGKANILSRHCTLMTFVELKFIYRPYLFVTLLREPLSLAVSMFYWKHQEKRAAPFKYMKRFRQEEPGSFSDRHRAHIHVYASQDEELRHKLKDYEIYGYMPQFAWFADTAQNAVKELIEREFLVGLVHRFDQLLVMLRYRLGIPTYRDILALSSNHYRHPKAAQWPRVSMQLLNGTGKIQTDWRFLSAAERIYNRQVREFGSARLRRETSVYKHLMRNLRAACDPEGKEFRAAERFLPRCKPGQGSCSFDLAATTRCALEKYDDCSRGSAVNAGSGLCEREVQLELNMKGRGGA